MNLDMVQPRIETEGLFLPKKIVKRFFIIPIQNHMKHLNLNLSNREKLFLHHLINLDLTPIRWLY